LKNVIHSANIIGACDVELHEFKARLFGKMPEVSQTAGEKIVNANNVVAFGQKRITKM